MKNIKYINQFIFAALIMLLFNGCEREENTQPTACFNFSPSSNIKPGDEISFTNCSTDAATYSWEFGDNKTSVAKDPKHQYDEAGNYDVTLVVTNKNLQDQIVKTITILSDLTGTWNKSFTISDSEFNGVLTLEQDDNKLSGNFIFSDGSGLTDLLSGSSVDGNSVTIIWMLEAYECTFPGTLNSANNYMNGNWNVDGSAMGDWSATKTSKKKVANTNSNSEISELERFLKYFNK